MDSVLRVSEGKRSRKIRANPVSLDCAVHAGLHEYSITGDAGAVPDKVSRAASSDSNERAGLQPDAFAGCAKAIAAGHIRADVISLDYITSCALQKDTPAVGGDHVASAWNRPADHDICRAGDEDPFEEISPR